MKEIIEKLFYRIPNVEERLRDMIYEEERKDYYSQKGDYSLKEVECLMSIKDKPEHYISMTKAYMEYLGQDTKNLDGIELCIYNKLHHALASYVLAENALGIERVKSSMAAQRIEYNLDYEDALIKHLHSIPYHDIMEDKKRMGQIYLMMPPGLLW